MKTKKCSYSRDAIFSSMYENKLRNDMKKQNEDYKRWLSENQEVVDRVYEIIATSFIKCPDKETFYRYLYKSSQDGFY